MKVLSIDAWGNKKEGYEWNNWFTVGEISKEDFENLKKCLNIVITTTGINHSYNHITN